MKVVGTLLIHPDVPSFENGTARVTVEDAARADTAATPIGAVAVERVAHATGEAGEVRFTLECAPPPPGRAWRVRARIDVAGDRGGAPGDLYSSESVAAAPDSGPLILRVAPSQGAGRWPIPTITR